MAKVESNTAVEELPPEEVVTDVDEASEAEGKKTRHREKWAGGYNQIWDNADAAKSNPVLFENGEEAEDFFIYKIEEKDADDKNVLKTIYTWGRNNTESLINVIDATMNLHCSKLDAKRGRQKMFKPDINLVQLLTSMKERKDNAGITQFLSLFPLYTYVIDGSEQPTTIN